MSMSHKPTRVVATRRAWRQGKDAVAALSLTNGFSTIVIGPDDFNHVATILATVMSERNTATTQQGSGAQS